MGELLLGIDVGTGSTKGVLVTPGGEVVGEHVVPHGLEIPRPGWAEHDAEGVWWHDVVSVCRALTSGSVSGADIAGVALSAIGPCLLPVAADGRPLRKGILYGVDTRATHEIAELESELGADEIFAHSGMPLSSQAIGPKLRWLLRHEPSVWHDAHTFHTASSWLVERLTGERVMDRHTASHWMPLFDLRAGTWSERYTEGLADVGRLPRLGWSDERAGEVTTTAAATTGLRAGTPVAVGTVDAVAESISVGAVAPGDLMIMYGSTTFFVLVTDAPHPDPRVWTTRGAFAEQYALAAGMATTGSLTAWFKDALVGGGDAGAGGTSAPSFADLFAAAATVPPGADGLLALPYFSGERTPIQDPDARGVIAGLSLGHGRAHVFRALLEGVAYGVRHNLETFRSMGAPIRRVIAVGGGTQGGLWTQIVSDVSGTPQERTRPHHGAAFGDAFLAGVATGALRRADLATWVRPDARVEPDTTARALYDAGFERYLRLYRASRDVVHELAHEQASGARGSTTM
ncbi:FGGY-family carbohydrate kinase [soil metagenome]